MQRHFSLKYVSIPAEKCLAQHENSSLPVTSPVFRYTLGSKTFERWLLEAPDAPSLITRVCTHFELGGHKAAAIAMVLESARIDLVSTLPDALVRRIFLHPQPSAQQALDEALARYGDGADILAMPFGGATLPTAEAERRN